MSRRNPFGQLDIRSFLERLGIEARQRGREMWAVCPFPDHRDRSPSWHIRNDPGAAKHGWWKCFPCDRGGGPLSLVRELLCLDMEGARAWFAGEDFATPVPQGPIFETELIGIQPLRFTLPKEVVSAPLEHWMAPAQRYMVGRGVTSEQIDRWRLAYAVMGRLRGRVVLPAYSASGRLQSYSARTFVGAERRYLAPDAAEGAVSCAVFGAQHWRRYGTIVMCEGAFDALAADRVTKHEVGALFGSQCLPIVVAELMKFERVLFAFDPDKAGNRVARELHESLMGIVDLGRIEVPVGLDLNDLWLHDESALRRLLL